MARLGFPMNANDYTPADDVGLTKRNTAAFLFGN
jgi:hypothetical protein